MVPLQGSQRPRSIGRILYYIGQKIRQFQLFFGVADDVRKALDFITSAEWESKYKNKESIEIEDDENYYFLKINELRQAHETVPLGYVKKEIEILLLNKRKIFFEENLEKDINAEGLRKDYVKIY